MRLVTFNILRGRSLADGAVDEARFAAAIKQLDPIRRALARVPGPVVLMGDLNLAGGQPARLSGYRPLARRPTMPSTQPDHQIDHILLRGRLGPVCAVGIPEMDLSDHRPLVVEVAPPLAL